MNGVHSNSNILIELNSSVDQLFEWVIFTKESLVKILYGMRLSSRESVHHIEEHINRH